jgi:hypothetical protein
VISTLHGVEMNDDLVRLALAMGFALWILIFSAIVAFGASVEGSGARGDIGTVYGNDLIACQRARQDAWIKASEACRGRIGPWQWSGCSPNLNPFSPGAHGTLSFSCQ